MKKQRFSLDILSLSICILESLLEVVAEDFTCLDGQEDPTNTFTSFYEAERAFNSSTKCLVLAWQKMQKEGLPPWIILFVIEKLKDLQKTTKGTRLSLKSSISRLEYSIKDYLERKEK